MPKVHTQNKKFAYLFNMSRKTWDVKLIFCLQINAKVCYKLILSRWVCIARHAQITQNSKFVISLQCLKENVQYLCKISRKTLRMKLIFLPADENQIFLLLFHCNILKKRVMKLIFCMHISMNVSYKLMLWFLIGMVKHSQSSQNSKFAMS